MNTADFRRRGKEMVDYVADYLETVDERQPMSGITPGYMKPLIPTRAPEQPDTWEDVINDIQRVIMPGVGQIIYIYSEYKLINNHVRRTLFYDILNFILFGNI